MILVDTSVWIDWLLNHDTAATQTLNTLLDEPAAILRCDRIVQELLQGIRNETDATMQMPVKSNAAYAYSPVSIPAVLAGVSQRQALSAASQKGCHRPCEQRCCHRRTLYST